MPRRGVALCCLFAAIFNSAGAASLIALADETSATSLSTQPTSQPASQPDAPHSPNGDKPHEPSPLEGGQALLDRVQAALVELVRRVDPSVVTIQADRSPAALGARNEGSQRSWTSTGAGVFIRDDGMILTSQHVIDRATTINVVLHDGRTLRALPIAEDRRADLAVIRVNIDGCAAAQLADADAAERGHIVVALGNPLGLAGDGQASVSHGIISAIARPLPENFGRDEDRYYGDMIQTTAPISPGNSGGPLIDIQGRVIGIITAVSTRSDGREGIGFAVPINRHTRMIIDRLLRGQPIEYGYLGVEVEPLDERRGRIAGVAVGEGVLINSVFPGGPAERAGLRGGDVVVAVNNETTPSVEHFVKTIGALGPQHIAAIRYLRDGKSRSAKVTLTRRPSNDKKPLPDTHISFRGAELGSLTPATRVMANLPENALLVLRVEAESPADRAGLTPGDIVVRLDGQPLSEAALERLPYETRDVVIGLANGGTLVVKSLQSGR